MDDFVLQGVTTMRVSAIFQPDDDEVPPNDDHDSHATDDEEGLSGAVVRSRDRALVFADRSVRTDEVGLHVVMMASYKCTGDKLDGMGDDELERFGNEVRRSVLEPRMEATLQVAQSMVGDMTILPPDDRPLKAFPLDA